MSSDMPSAFVSTVEHFGSPGKVVFTAYDAVIHTIFLNGLFRPHLAQQVGTTRSWMCQEAGSTISINALNYPPTVVAQVVLIRSNYGCRNVYVMYVCELQKKLRVLQAMHGGLRSVWLPSQGGSTGS